MFFRDSSLAKGDAFLALFAINSLSSWYSLQELRKKIIREHEGEDSVPLVVIANKSVSDVNYAVREKKRAVGERKREREREREGGRGGGGDSIMLTCRC